MVAVWLVYWSYWTSHDNRNVSLVDPGWLMFELCQLSFVGSFWEPERVFAASQPLDHSEPAFQPNSPEFRGGKHAIEPGFTKENSKGRIAVDEKVPTEKQKGTTTESTVATCTGGQGWVGMRWLMLADVGWCFHILFAAICGNASWKTTWDPCQMAQFQSHGPQMDTRLNADLIEESMECIQLFATFPMQWSNLSCLLLRVPVWSWYLKHLVRALTRSCCWSWQDLMTREADE